MARSWTPAQQEAINANEGRYLIAAGAGSGKTAVLTERIHRLLGDGKIHHLSELLVLTFTNKAAHEMKERVRSAIMGDPLLKGQADEVESADITTFDAFALSLVKKYHYDLGLSSDVTIMDENALELKTREFLDAILEEHYESRSAAFLDFVHHYALKDDSQIQMMTLEVYHQALLSGDPEAFFQNAVQNAYDPVFLDGEFSRFLSLEKDKLAALKEDAAHLSSGDLADFEAAFFSPFLECSSYDGLYALLLGKRYPSIPKEMKEDLTSLDGAIHEALKDGFNGVKEDFALFGPQEEASSRLLLSRPYAEIWTSLAQELYQRLSLFQKEKGVYSFEDIASLARKAVQIPAISSSLKERYHYTMVDEYQDTSALQQRFLDAFNNGNFFAVGDVKQSIYRFRHADPALFKELRERYLHGEGTLITLQDNFRSRKEVLEDINALFSKTMSPALGDVTYDAKEALGFGNRSLYEKTGDPRYRMETLLYEKKDDTPAAEMEARLIASDIERRVGEAFPLASQGGALRPCRYDDFAILIPRKRDFPIYKKVFSEAKIPLDVTADLDLSNEDVSMLFLSFIALPLALRGDMEKVKHCYASIARSYLYEESDADLYDEIVSGRYLSSPLIRFFQEHEQEILTQESAKSVLLYFDSFPLFEKLPRLGDVKENAEKLSSFLSQAENYDRLGADYEEFASHFVSMASYDVTMAISSPKAAPKSVRLMSVHASKGLEFPIVYIPDLAAKVNIKAIHATFGYSPKHGFLIPLSLVDGNPFNILHALADEEEKTAELSERMRLYYVALTRAKEKIIFLERKQAALESIPLDQRHLLKIRSHPEKGEDDSPTSSLVSAMSFLDFAHLSGLTIFNPHAVEIPSKSPLESASSRQEEIPAPEKRSVSFLPEEAIHTRASKSSMEPLDESALAYGTYLHRLLEVTDFRSKDTGFIQNEKDRALIGRVLAHPLFARLENALIYKEYAFYDKKKNLHGSIDLLLVYPDHAVVVDYKAKSISDPHYLEQVALYKAFVEESFKRNCETYLLSIIGGSLKKVE